MTEDADAKGYIAVPAASISPFFRIESLGPALAHAILDKQGNEKVYAEERKYRFVIQGNSLTVEERVSQGGGLDSSYEKRQKISWDDPDNGTIQLRIADEPLSPIRSRESYPTSDIPEGSSFVWLQPKDNVVNIVGEQGVKVIDVRSPGEFAAGHIEGAINIPSELLTNGTQFERRSPYTIPKDLPISPDAAYGPGAGVLTKYGVNAGDMLVVIGAATNEASDDAIRAAAALTHQKAPVRCQSVSVVAGGFSAAKEMGAHIVVHASLVDRVMEGENLSPGFVSSVMASEGRHVLVLDPNGHPSEYRFFDGHTNPDEADRVGWPHIAVKAKLTLKQLDRSGISPRVFSDAWHVRDSTVRDKPVGSWGLQGDRDPQFTAGQRIGVYEMFDVNSELIQIAPLVPKPVGQGKTLDRLVR